MTERWESEIEAELATLGRSARAAAPRPGDDLVARVLADAAAAAPPETETPPAPARRARRLPALGELLARPGLAAACAAACLAVGIGLGYGLGAPQAGVALAAGEGLMLADAEDTVLAGLPL